MIEDTDPILAALGRLEAGQTATRTDLTMLRGDLTNLCNDVTTLRTEVTTLMACMGRIQESINAIRNDLRDPGETDQHD
ncbi:MAG: hypothetical protein JOZ17_10270 [Acetobacteraceae bacterium]|nr:hypothetical protein [Acetobacteraceae bacterium]